MATPTVFDSDMLRMLVEAVKDYEPRQSLLVSTVEVHDIPPEQVFDWSACRSPARAQRRYRQGHPQRVKISYRERAFLFDKRVLTYWTNSYERMAVKMMLGESQ